VAGDAHPDRQLYAEWQVWAAQAMVGRLPPTDPVRQALVAGSEIDAAWAVEISHSPDSQPVITHPLSGPTVMYPALGRWYRALPASVENVLVGQLSDDPGEDGEQLLDAGAAYIDGDAVVSLIERHRD
jgi:hypothetical protein